MTPETAVSLIKQALVMSFWVAAPLLVVAFIVGIVINLVQIVTSLQDTAVSTTPRLAAFLLALVLLLPWMTNRMMTYTTALLADFARHAR